MSFSPRSLGAVVTSSALLDALLGCWSLLALLLGHALDRTSSGHAPRDRFTTRQSGDELGRGRHGWRTASSTWALVPRSGSIIGIRLSGSPPTSRMMLSQLAATTASGQRARHAAAEVGPRARRGGSVVAAIDVGLVVEALDLAGAHEPLVERALGAHVVVLEVEQRELRVAPRRDRRASTYASSSDELRDPVELAVERRRVALERG